MPTPPPIIIKKKVSHGGHHGGAWKVAYADFVTAMMALFIVLWLMNSSKQIQQAVGGYFKDPTGRSKQIGSDMKGVGENFVVTKDNMKELKQQLEKSIREIPKFDELRNHIDMTVTNEGLRIELTESASGVFFESGSDQLSADGSDLVKLLAQELGKLPNPIAIEGHTDSKPYPTGAIYTNWELSSDRANSTRRLMQNNGIRPDQITQVRGFADQRLRKPEAPLDPSNRRISLIVQYLEKRMEDETSKEAKSPEDKVANANDDGGTKSSQAEPSGTAKTNPPEKK
jgi:chemotaxis protein MotB